MQPTDKTKMSRLPKRADYDDAIIYSILDEAMLCTVAYVNEDQAMQIPTGFVRIANKLYIHGSVGSHFLRMIADGRKVCISVTLLDGVLLARSVFDSSMNYRSVILFAEGFIVDDLAEKRDIFEKFTEKMIPGRWADVRQPFDSEINKTIIIGFELNEASAKVRQGWPEDGEAERDSAVWWGVLPTSLTYGEPLPHPETKAGVELPEYLKNLK